MREPINTLRNIGFVLFGLSMLDHSAHICSMFSWGW